MTSPPGDLIITAEDIIHDVLHQTFGGTCNLSHWTYEIIVANQDNDNVEVERIQLVFKKKIDIATGIFMCRRIEELLDRCGFPNVSVTFYFIKKSRKNPATTTQA